MKDIEKPKDDVVIDGKIDWAKLNQIREVNLVYIYMNCIINCKFILINESSIEKQKGQKN